MAIVNGYCTLAEYYARNGEFTAGADTGRDGIIEAMIEAASRWIDRHTQRKFYASSETRYFTARCGYEVRVPDLLSVTTLKTDEDGDRTYETTWATTDYDLMPYNYTPYQWIEITPNGNNVFPLLRKGIEIAGSWGYASTTPDDINEACLLLSARLYKRKDTTFGILGNTRLGQVTMQVPKDEDIIGLLQAYVKRDV